MEVVTFEPDEDEYTSTNEGSTTELNESDDITHENEEKIPPNSLLTLLDDKNRSICSLKRQINNQKMQLSFYLHRVFNSPKITELAESCVPYESEENIHINLAMNQFCKQAGLKSRIMLLHSRMIDIEKRIIRTLEQQEEMVRVIVNRIVEFKQCTTNDANTIQMCLAQLKKDCGQVEILAKVLGATNKLRKELDTFRTCCNRLMVIEDERNSLVEQVYSMPVSKRMGYGVLLAAQYEKMRLEKEVLEIKQEQKILQDRFASLAQEHLFADRAETPPARNSSSTDQANVNKMLETVNSEAVSLLQTTKEQKDKYVEEIARLREINVELAKQVVSMQNTDKEKAELEARMKLAAKEFKKLRDFDQLQLNACNERLMALAEEKTLMRNKLEGYNDIDEQIRSLRTQIQDMDTMRAQRDYYKLQVDDLQAIRAAYAQLVEHCPPAHGDEGDSKEQTRKIQDMEKHNMQMSVDIEHLTDVVRDQEMQIKHLLIIIEKLAKHRDVQTPTKVKRTLYSLQTTQNIMESTHSNYMENKDSGYSSESKSAYSQTDTNMLMLMKELQRPPPFASFEPPDPVDNDRISRVQETYSCIPCERSPIARARSPVSRERSPIAREGSAVARARSPISRERSPIARDRNSMVSERTPKCFVCANKPIHAIQNQQPSQCMCEFVATQEEQFNKASCIAFQDQRPRSKSPIAVRIPNTPGKSSFVATTSVEVQSINHEGKSESLKAILESSSPIEGIIEVNNSSALSLRLTCTANGKQNVSTSKQPSLASSASEERLTDEPSRLKLETPPIMDEYELLKDASRETLAVTLPSVQQKMMAVECVEYTCNNVETFDDRYANEECLSHILDKTDEGVQVIISRESIPHDVSDEGEDTEQKDDDSNTDEEINETDFEVVHESREGKGEKMNKSSELAGQLQHITLNLDQTLSQPGGKDCLLTAMKLMYNTFLRDVPTKL